MYKWAFFVRLIWVIFSIGKSGPFFFSCGLQIYFVYLSFIHWPVSDYLSFSSSVLSIILRKKKEKNDLNHRILLFSASLYYEPLRAARREQSKKLPSSRPAQLRQIPFLFSVLVLLSFGKCSYIFLAPTKKQKVHRTSKPNSFRKVWKNRNYDVVSWYGHSCYMWKIRLSVPGCSDRIDFTSVLVLRKTLISL